LASAGGEVFSGGKPVGEAGGVLHDDGAGAAWSAPALGGDPESLQAAGAVFNEDAIAGIDAVSGFLRTVNVPPLGFLCGVFIKVPG
jgi:hypothetical protein